MLKWILLCALALIAGVATALKFDHKLYKIVGIQKTSVVGFEPFWLLNRSDKDYSDYITDYTYFGLTIDTDGRIKKLVSPTEEEPGWTNLKSEEVKNRLKKARDKNLTTSIALHLSNEDEIKELLKNPHQSAENLIEDVSSILKDYRFADVNLDIESFTEASKAAQLSMTQFVRKFKNGLTGKQLTTLTIDVSPTALVKDFITDVSELGKIADRVVLMTYDYHYLGSTIAGPIAPINGVSVEREFDVETAIAEAVKVVPAKKLLLGIPLYGYEWETLNKESQAPTIPGGGSVASYQRIEELLRTCKKCTRGRGKLSKQPYVIFPDENDDYNHQIFYEDAESLALKLELARKYKLGGIALWALGYEGDNLLEPVKRFIDLYAPIGGYRLISFGK